MKWLIWKDYRLNRPVMVLAMLLLVAPHGLGAFLAWLSDHPRTGATPQEQLAFSLLVAVLDSTAALQVTLAVLGGNALAGERRDRSAEFLASLPIPRRRILLSKMIVALGLLALIWLPNLLILWRISPHVPSWGWFFGTKLHHVQTTFVTIATAGLMFFCVAWFFSARLESPTFCVLAGLIAPLATLYVVDSVLGISAELLGYQAPDSVIFCWGYDGVCLLLSALSFAAGTAYYLRHAEA